MRVRRLVGLTLSRSSSSDESQQRASPRAAANIAGLVKKVLFEVNIICATHLYFESMKGLQGSRTSIETVFGGDKNSVWQFLTLSREQLVS